MIMTRLLCLLCTLALLAGCAATPRQMFPAPELKILTENYPPLNFMENGSVTGQATDVVRELLLRTGSSATIRLTTWESGYKAALEEPNTLLFSVAMTPERQDQLQWVGPIASLDANLYARKGSKIRISSLAEAKQLGRIATVRDYYTEQLLKKEGFTNLDSCAQEEIAARKLLSGEVQLFPSNNTVMPAVLQKAGATMAEVESVFTISTNLVYLAFSRGTAPEVVALWQEKLDEMKRDGTFRKIYRQWLPAETPPEILQLVTEEYPPVTFTREGRVTGFVTDIVREIISRQQIPDNIRLTTWGNAYNLALHNPNVVLFSTERTPARENLFQWVGPVGKNSAILYAKKGAGISITSLEEAKKVGAIATTTDWFTEQHLKSSGFNNLRSAPLPMTNVRQLMAGEVQLSIFTDLTIPEIVKDAGYRLADLEPVFTVSTTEFYLAFSRGTPRETVDRWQAVLNDLKLDGTFEKIYRRYLPGADLETLLRR